MRVRASNALMILRAALLILLPALAFSAILPETIGEWKRGDPVAAPVPDQKVWNEYGLQDSETAPYSDNGKTFSITAYRFGDSTGAFAAWNAIRPADARAFEGDGTGVETAADRYIAVGNYLLIFHGYKPSREELGHVYLTAPRYAHAPLPTLPRYLPSGATANSERYILGPESLARFAPEIPAATAAFHFSSEAELAAYGGKTTVVVFNFPGMEMAQKQYPKFQEIPGAVAKRSGPLVAIVLHATTPDEAERLLAQVKYEAEVTMAEPPPSLKNNPANLFLNIIILCGVLASFCVVSGLIVGGIRLMRQRAGAGNDGEEMITLHLSGR